MPILDLWADGCDTDCAQMQDLQAFQRFFSELEKDHFLFFKLQILWLRHKFPHRLGKELSGEYGEAEQVSATQGAVALYRIARLQYLQVKPYGQKTLPMVEGLIRFQRVTYSFLPRTQPAVFMPDGKIITFSHLKTEGKTADQAVNFLIRRIRGAE